MENRDKLDLFEGIVIGIYGNWLISLLDKVSFTKAPFIGHIVMLWYQPFCLVVSFTCLLLLVGFSIFRPELVTIKFVFVLSAGHFAGNYGVLWVEGLTIKNTVFLLIGTFLFFILYLCELTRVGRIRRRSRGVIGVTPMFYLKYSINTIK